MINIVNIITVKHKICCIVLVLLLFALPSAFSAENTDAQKSLPLSSLTESTGTETVTVNLSDLYGEESMHYAFLYGYQAMLQDLCNGALLTFDENDNYITGYLTPNAPDDFCTRISAHTIAVSEPVTSETMSAMYSLFGDRLSLSTLMARDDEAYVAVIMFEPVDGMVVTPMWYAEAERKIKNEAVARGINPEEVYSYQAENGYDKDTLVAMVAEGTTTASTVVSDAVIMKNNAKEKANVSTMERLGINSNSLTQIIIVGLLVFGAIMFIYLVVRLFTKSRIPVDTESEDDEDDTDNQEEDENDE